MHSLENKRIHNRARAPVRRYVLDGAHALQQTCLQHICLSFVFSCVLRTAADAAAIRCIILQAHMPHQYTHTHTLCGIIIFVSAHKTASKPINNLFIFVRARAACRTSRRASRRHRRQRRRRRRRRLSCMLYCIRAFGGLRCDDGG